jgi:type I restriction enzyme S subunit
MPDLDWSEQAIGDIFRINTASVLPNTFPRSLFYHHSLPAWDECGGPLVEPGISIESNKTALKVPCVLVSKLNPRKPRVSAVTNIPDDQNHCASTEFVCLEPATDSIPLSFWHHFFSHKQFSNRLDRVAIGSTNSHKRYGPRELLSFRISTPSVAEQEVIAQIFDTLDTQIQKSEALIAKLEKIKEGLLFDLLTRGIDQDGQLRPTLEQAPELYKKSALGLIPKEWHKGAISDYLLQNGGIKPGPFGSSITKNMYRSKGYKIYGQEQVIRSDHTFGDYYIDRNKYSELIDFSVQSRDILISLVGTIGKVLIIPTGHERGIINPRLMRLRPNQNACDSEFLSHVLTSTFFTRKLTALAGGGTMPVINKRIVQSVALPVIPLVEQSAIRSKISSLLGKLANEKAILAKLRAQKSGLMDDLLTGRVRVTPLLKDAV